MNFQKANVFNQYLPYSSAIYQQSLASFDEICENLSRLIQAQELQPGFPLWSSKLQQFLSLYGFSFTKAHHLKLIHFYLSILSIQDLNYIHAKISFDLIVQLTRFVLLINFQIVHVFCFTFYSKTRLITRDELTIDWKLLYHWGKLILFNHDESYSLIAMPKFVCRIPKRYLTYVVVVFFRNIENSYLLCVRSCRPYFSANATQEILDEFRPCLCPFDTVCGDVMCYWDSFLPVHLPPELHHQGFK